LHNTNLSIGQVSFLLFMILLGNTFATTPISGVGRDIWLIILLSSVTGLYLILAMVTIQRAFPGQSIIQISEICLGKIAGKTLNLLFITIIFYITIIYLSDLCIVIRTLLPFLTCNLLRPLIMFTAVFCIYKGINSIGRLAELIMPLILLFITANLLVISTTTDFFRIYPLLADWRIIAGGLIDAAGWPYSGIIVIAILLPFVSDIKQSTRSLYIWYFVGVIIFTVRILLLVATLGIEYLELSRFPLYSALDKTAFANFERVELFFFALWFVFGFMALLINYLAGILAIKEWFNLADIRSIILPAAFFLVVISLYTYSSDMEFYFLEVTTTPLLALFINILYPTIILIALKLRRSKLPSTRARLNSAPSLANDKTLGNVKPR
jgi:spore germination protein KB